MTRGMASRAIVAFAALAALSACQTLKSLTEPSDSSEAQTSAYDDSVKRPPLTLPPDFNLRPPATSGVGATDVTASQQARQTVFGLDQQKPEANVQRKAGRTLGESALLQRAGANAVAPNIRSQVDRQTNTLDSQQKTFTDNLLKPDNGQQPADKKDSGGWLGSVFNSNTDQKPTIERKGGIFGDLF